MSDTWHIEYVETWWLPNEEGQTPFIKSIQELTRQREEYRALPPQERPTDSDETDILDMVGLFRTLELALSPSVSNHSDSSPELGNNAQGSSSQL